MVARLKEKYQKEIAPALMQELGLKTIMQVPRLEKIVLNIGIGEAIQNAKSLDAAVSDLTQISGQKPVITRARRSIAGFKVRQGMPIGAMVTLRGQRMYEFLDRMINLALPRIRDFRGISRRAFDGRGNYSVGLREQIVFPEINYDKVDKIRGLEVAIVTTAPDDAQGYALLRRFGMPFRD
jgi:large subunit ribosomal protein L5